MAKDIIDGEVDLLQSALLVLKRKHGDGYVVGVEVDSLHRATLTSERIHDKESLLQ